MTDNSTVSNTASVISQYMHRKYNLATGYSFLFSITLLISCLTILDIWFKWERPPYHYPEIDSDCVSPTYTSGSHGSVYQYYDDDSSHFILEIFDNDLNKLQQI